MSIAPLINIFPAHVEEGIAIFCEAMGFLAFPWGHPSWGQLTYFLSSTEHQHYSTGNTSLSAHFSCSWKLNTIGSVTVLVQFLGFHLE